jgi:hypothetical protein
VGTPAYREKDHAEDTDPVVQAELRLIKSRLMSRDEVRNTVIPLLRAGKMKESFPPLFETSVFLDFETESSFFLHLFELVMTIHRIPFDNKMARQHRDQLSNVSEIEIQPRRVRPTA